MSNIYCRPLKNPFRLVVTASACVKLNLTLNLAFSFKEGRKEGRKEGSVLFNDAFNTLYVQVFGVKCRVKDNSDSEKVNHCCHLLGYVLFNDALNTFYLRLYGVRHMVKDHSAREETRCHHIGYSFQLAARVLLYASSHRQDNAYQSLCYTSRGTLAGMRNSSMGPPLCHEQTLLSRSYISLLTFFE